MQKTITIKLDEELHRDFKIKMVLDKNTMQDRVIELIENEVRDFRNAQGSNKSF